MVNWALTVSLIHKNAQCGFTNLIRMVFLVLCDWSECFPYKVKFIFCVPTSKVLRPKFGNHIFPYDSILYSMNKNCPKSRISEAIIVSFENETAAGNYIIFTAISFASENISQSK